MRKYKWMVLGIFPLIAFLIGGGYEKFTMPVAAADLHKNDRMPNIVEDGFSGTQSSVAEEAAKPISKDISERGQSSAADESPNLLGGGNIRSDVSSVAIKQDPVRNAVSRFESEVRNEDWAAVREEELRVGMATDSALSGKEVKSIECKASVCRIQIYAEAKRELIAIARDINMFVMKQQNDHLSPYIHATFSESDKTANFFIGDEKPLSEVQRKSE